MFDSRAIGRVGFTLVLMTTSIACEPGEYHHPVHATGGVVIRGGEPLVDALVTFHPTDPSALTIPEGREGPAVASPTAHTGDQGEFSMSTYFAGDGVPAGSYKVTIAFLGEPATGAELPESGDETGIEAGRATVPRRPRWRIAPVYSNAETTPLRVTVTEGGENQFTLEVE